MPYTICRAPGCQRTSREDSPCCSDRCQDRYDAGRKTTRQTADRERGSSTERGYDYRWQHESDAHKRANPICSRCEAQGIPKLADEGGPDKPGCTDHIVPVQGGRSDPLFDNTDNWQTLCWDCHNHKTQSCDKAIRERYDAQRTLGASVEEALLAATFLWKGLIIG